MSRQWYLSASVYQRNKSPHENPEGMPLVAHNLRLVGPKKAAWLNDMFGLELTDEPVSCGDGRMFDPVTGDCLNGGRK